MKGGEKMKAKIVKVEEQGDSLKVTVSHIYGIDKLGISKSMQEYSYLTGQPKWIEEVKRLLEKKYKNAKAPKLTKFEGKDIELNIGETEDGKDSSDENIGNNTETD